MLSLSLLQTIRQRKVCHAESHVMILKNPSSKCHQYSLWSPTSFVTGLQATMLWYTSPLVKEQNPEFVWSIEYDVGFTGDIATIIDEYREVPADLIGKRPCQTPPEWVIGCGSFQDRTFWVFAFRSRFNRCGILSGASLKVGSWNIFPSRSSSKCDGRCSKVHFVVDFDC